MKMVERAVFLWSSFARITPGPSVCKEFLQVFTDKIQQAPKFVIK